MRTGKIQMVFKANASVGEKNQVVSFKGWFDFQYKMMKAYQSRAYKTYIFFDEPKIKNNG